MKKAERERFTHMRARELAASGKHQNWHGIEAELRIKENLAVPDDRLFREELDLACQRATDKPAYGGDFMTPSWERAMPGYRTGH